MKNILLMLCLIFSSFAYASTFDSRAKEHLDVRLETIGEVSRRERLWQGATSLTAGLAMAAGALFTPSSQVASDVPVALGVGSALFALSGITSLIFPTDFEAIPKHYAQIPARTPEEVILKVGKGESYLALLASRARSNRFYSASVSLALGAGEIVWYATEPTTNRNYLLFQGILLVIRGAMPFFFESESEAQLRAYRDWKSGQRISFNWNIVPRQDGAGLVAALRF